MEVGKGARGRLSIVFERFSLTCLCFWDPGRGDGKNKGSIRNTDFAAK